MEHDLTLSVTEVADLAAAALSGAFPDLVWVEGEICNLNRSAKDHVYFSLIEPGADRRSAPTQLSVTLFAWMRTKVNQQIRNSGGNIRVEDGVRVRIRGNVELYRARGQLQLKMVAIDPSYTLGTLAADRARLLARLAAEDLLDANSARPLPPMPLRIGLVTSTGSAAHADFLHEIEAAGIGFEVLAADARVQGVDAPESIVRAIEVVVDAGAEVVCVVRGGGARTDLAAFDDESVARAIATCPIPVWVGIGHEIDRTVADDVAHSSFKTPTACAAGIVAVARAAIEQLATIEVAVAHNARRRLDQGAADLDRLARDIAFATRTGVERGAHHAERAAARVGAASLARLVRAERHLERGDAVVALLAPRRIQAATREIDALAAQVRALDPARVMERGWSLTRDRQGRVVRSAHTVSVGDELVTRFADGEATSTVSAVEQR